MKTFEKCCHITAKKYGFIFTRVVTFTPDYQNIFPDQYTFFMEAADLYAKEVHLAFDDWFYKCVENIEVDKIKITGTREEVFDRFRKEKGL